MYNDNSEWRAMLCGHTASAAALKIRCSFTNVGPRSRKHASEEGWDLIQKEASSGDAELVFHCLCGVTTEEGGIAV